MPDLEKPGKVRRKNLGANRLRLLEILSDCISVVGKPKACSHNVQDGQRHEISPSEAHQLVITEARKRSPHPHIEEQEAEDFGDKPEDGKQGVDKDVLRWPYKVAERACPSAQKKQRGHTTHVDHVGVFGHEKHGELHGTVLGVVDRKSVV